MFIKEGDMLIISKIPKIEESSLKQMKRDVLVFFEPGDNIKNTINFIEKVGSKKKYLVIGNK